MMVTFLRGNVMNTNQNVKAQLQQELLPGEYDEIRALWKVHSIAEDQRDIAGLMSTLTDNCVYTLPQADHSWQRKAGAEQFYIELLTAFPDIHFDLENIIIGPQGVFELANVSATFREKWLKHPPTNEVIEFKVNIIFPWDRELKMFKGEIVYIDTYEQIMNQ